MIPEQDKLFVVLLPVLSGLKNFHGNIKMKPLATSWHHRDKRSRHGSYLAIWAWKALCPMKVKHSKHSHKWREQYNELSWFIIDRRADNMTKFNFNETSRDLSEPWIIPFSPNVSSPLSSIFMFAFKIYLVLESNLNPVWEWQLFRAGELSSILPVSSGWCSESLKTRWKVMKTLSLWAEISLTCWVLKDYHNVIGFCKWHMSRQGDVDKWVVFGELAWRSFIIQTTQRSGLSRQLGRMWSV